MSRLGQTLLADRDAIGLEIGRLRTLQSSVEDPGPFYIPGRFQQRWDGGAQISAANLQEAAAQGYPWPVLVANPDYIADEVRRAQVQAELQSQIDALQAQLDGVVAEIFGEHPGGVITVTGRTDPATGKVVETITSRPPDIVAPPTGAPVVLPEDVPPAAGGGAGGGFIIPDDPNEVSQAGMAASGGLGLGMLVAGGAALWFLFGRRRRKDA